ncbi:MAG: hypothetical protein NKF70_00010 [Methanobacterium sp. ERen5]|nr:MAG: hypothetical protein NKF70_00010 [Methanobacterium sp. ERen5]
MSVDIEKFKDAINASSEVDIDFTELIQNLHIDNDGNIESQGNGLYVLVSPEYEILVMSGGVSKKASQLIMNSTNGCD